MCGAGGRITLAHFRAGPLSANGCLIILDE